MKNLKLFSTSVKKVVLVYRIPAAMLERKGVKKQLKQDGSISIPREAFLERMKIS